MLYPPIPRAILRFRARHYMQKYQPMGVGLCGNTCKRTRFGSRWRLNFETFEIPIQILSCVSDGIRLEIKGEMRTRIPDQASFPLPWPKVPALTINLCCRALTSKAIMDDQAPPEIDVLHVTTVTI